MGANYARTKIKTKLENNQEGVVWGGGTKMSFEMCSLSLFAEKGEELTCRSLYIADVSARDK